MPFSTSRDTSQSLRRLSLHPASQSYSCSCFPRAVTSARDMELTPCGIPFMPRLWDPLSHQCLQSYQPPCCAEDGWRAGCRAPFPLTGALITKTFQCAASQTQLKTDRETERVSGLWMPRGLWLALFILVLIFILVQIHRGPFVSNSFEMSMRNFREFQNLHLVLSTSREGLGSHPVPLPNPPVSPQFHK